MPYKFIDQPLQSGLYEPEGVYLHAPAKGKLLVLQPFGALTAYCSQFTYNGVPLRGHNGVDFGVALGAPMLAVDGGHVVEISQDDGGLGRYIKVEHRWGESLYALVADAVVDSGQSVKRGQPLGVARRDPLAVDTLTLFHFGIRIAPFNRFDGWGGFANPLLFLSPTDLTFLDADDRTDAWQELALETTPLHALQAETPKLRRP